MYRDRRERVMRELDGCVAVLAAQGETSRVTEDYRQDGGFLWLTGLNEGESWLLLAPRAKYDRSVLFLRSRDPERERWTGPRDPLSPAMLERHGVDRVLRGRPDRTAVAAAMGSECVAVIAPVGDLKDERPDAVLSRQIAQALGLKLVYKRDLLARLRAARALREGKIAATDMNLFLMTDVPAQAVRVVLDAYAAQTRIASERAQREREADLPRPIDPDRPPPRPPAGRRRS